MTDAEKIREMEAAIMVLARLLHERNVEVARLRDRLQVAEFHRSALATLVEVGAPNLGGRICPN